MKANYHTHTARCGHAAGTDEEYVGAALSQGFDVLGFSDHVPWPYRSGFTRTHTRMTIDRLDEYVASVSALKEKYAGKIHILTGFECEYFPEYMDWLAEMKEEKQLDYLIFGNHYEGSDEYGMYFGNTATADDLRRYVDCAQKGLQTGLFAYLAHPDVFMRGYGKFDENCRAAAKDLCRACKDLAVPMEYNLHDRFRLGEAHTDGYPHPKFFEIVLEEGVPVIIGVDAHNPVELSDPAQWNRAERELQVFGDRWLRSLDK